MYLALDCETTGLDADKDYILEVAWAFLDDKLERLTETKSFLVTPGEGMWSRLYSPGNSYVIGMHEHSGLVDELDHPEKTLHIDDITRQIIDEWFTVHLSTGTDELILLGNSPHGVDRPFIAYWMPPVEQMLSHRHLDVTSLWMVAQAAGLPDTKSDEPTHRAKDDIDSSIVAVQQYRTVMGLDRHHARNILR